MPGFPCHGERIVDGDASTLTALTLYEAGSTTERVLAATEFLHITDIMFAIETAADISLVADSAAGGRYIFSLNIWGQDFKSIHFKTPYVCPRGVVPKFAGSSTNRSSCVIQGYIMEA